MIDSIKAKDMVTYECCQIVNEFGSAQLSRRDRVKFQRMKVHTSRFIK